MNLQRRVLLAAASAAALSARLGWGAKAQRLRRIGYFGVTPPDSAYTEHGLMQFREGLREQGLVEGRDYALEYVWETRIERVPSRMQALAQSGVDLIVAQTTPVALAAAKATRDIPIVFGLVSDPVGSGLVQSLAHPGGNVTGVTNVLPALSGKLLELAREIAPGISRVATMWNPDNPAKTLELHELHAAARQAGVALSLLPVRSTAEIEAALAGMGGTQVQFLVTLSETLTHQYRKRIAELALAARMPSVFNNTSQVEAGGLVSYAPEYTVLSTAARQPHRPDPRGRTARHAAGRAADQVRPSGKPEDRAGDRHHHSAVGAAARRPGDRMKRGRPSERADVVRVLDARGLPGHVGAVEGDVGTVLRLVSRACAGRCVRLRAAGDEEDGEGHLQDRFGGHGALLWSAGPGVLAADPGVVGGEDEVLGHAARGQVLGFELGAGRGLLEGLGDAHAGGDHAAAGEEHEGGDAGLEDHFGVGFHGVLRGSLVGAGVLRRPMSHRVEIGRRKLSGAGRRQKVTYAHSEGLAWSCSEVME